MSINKDQVQGRIKEAAGKVQESTGKAMGSGRQQIKGNIKKNTGAAQARFGDAKKERRRREEGSGAFKVEITPGALRRRNDGARLQDGTQMAMRMAPAVIKTLPNPTFQVRRSPRKSIANKTTRTTLSLSMGATRDAGPICSAR